MKRPVRLLGSVLLASVLGCVSAVFAQQAQTPQSFLELSEPVVIQVPEFGDRFWVYAAYDQRTDQFGELGKPYGTKPGFYLLAGPNWKGEAPKHHGRRARLDIAGQYHPSNLHERHG